MIIKNRSLVLFIMAAVLCGSVFAAEPYRSVVDYGAKANDDGDDTVAFQKAIAAAGAEAGGVVFVPAGRYIISDTLVIDKPGVTLLGEGRGMGGSRTSSGSRLVFRGTKASTAVLVKDCAYSGLKNLCVDNDAVDAQTANGRKDALVRLEGTYHAFINELYIGNPINGIDILNGISPLLEDVDIKWPRGDYGIWLHGSGKSGGDGKYRKVDAALFYRVAGGATADMPVEWTVVGPNVDGAEINDARFVAGRRGLVLRGGDPAAGDVRPKYIYTHKFGCDHVADEGVLMEAGSEVFMTNTWIGQNKHSSGIVVGEKFMGGVLITNVRVRGSGGHGLHIRGGRNIYINNPLVGACGSDKALPYVASGDAAGVMIEREATQVRITGGGVCELFQEGKRSRQHYGVCYAGTKNEAVAGSIAISGVDTSGNEVAVSPAELSLDAKR